MKKIIALLLAMALVLSLAACSAKQVTSAATEAPTEASEWSKTIVDVVGNEITLEAPATRLVDTHNPTMNMAAILGDGGKYIAGFGNKEMADVLYSYVYPELQDDIIQICKGKNINYEAVLTTDADLAILSQRFAYMVEEFNAVDIPAIVILTSKESYDPIRNSLTLVGQVPGVGEAGDVFSFSAAFQSISGWTFSCRRKETPGPCFAGRRWRKRKPHRIRCWSRTEDN